MTNLNQNGRSMIEMLGVLAIIGVLSVGGIAGYSKAMMKFKTNKTIDQIAMTVTNIRTLYAQQKDYDITTSQAYKMGVVDDAIVLFEKKGGSGTDKDNLVDKGKLTNAFSGWAEIAPAKSGVQGETTGAFVVTFGGLPREACVAIATNDWGSGYSSGLLGIGTGAAADATTHVIGDIPCDVNGASVASPTGVKDGETNVTYTALTKYSCAVGKVSAAFSVADAATGCNCTGTNSCYVTLKYY